MNKIKIKAQGLFIFAVFVSGCATRTKVLEVQYISMSQIKSPKKNQLIDLQPVSSQYCLQDQIEVSEKGLLDEALLGAQNQIQADYLHDVTVWREGDCLFVQAIGQKVILPSNRR